MNNKKEDLKSIMEVKAKRGELEGISKYAILDNDKR